MTLMIAVHGIGTVRDGKPFHVKAGQAFDATDEEIAHLGNKLRAPKAELASAEVARPKGEEADKEPVTEAPATEAPAARRPGRPRKPADLSDI